MHFQALASSGKLTSSSFGSPFFLSPVMGLQSPFFYPEVLYPFPNFGWTTTILHHSYIHFKPERGAFIKLLSSRAKELFLKLSKHPQKIEIRSFLSLDNSACYTKQLEITTRDPGLCNTIHQAFFSRSEIAKNRERRKIWVGLCIWVSLEDVDTPNKWTIPSSFGIGFDHSLDWGLVHNRHRSHIVHMYSTLSYQVEQSPFRYWSALAPTPKGGSEHPAKHTSWWVTCTQALWVPWGEWPLVWGNFHFLLSLLFHAWFQ